MNLNNKNELIGIKSFPLSDEHYFSVFNFVQDGVVVQELVYDQNGVPCNYKILDVNPQYEKLINRKKEEIVNKFATEIFNTTDPPYFDIFVNVAKNNLHINFETYDQLLNKYFNIFVSSSGDGIFTTIYSDLTEKKELIHELKKALDKSEESNKLKSSLLSNLSHEFRTPMTGILGMSSILKEKLRDPENLTMLDYVIASGNRLMKTLNAILELAEEESNIKNLKSVYITGVAEPIIKEYMQKAEQKGLVFKYDILDDQLAVNSNERVLSQVFLHLIDNAVKFTEQGFVQVTISSEKSDDIMWAKIVVRDTGLGILPKDQELIFHEFRQVSEGISRCFEGVGLGLTLVKKMVGLMKGKISLESELRHGSCFTVYLPAQRMQNEAEIEEKKIIIMPKTQPGNKTTATPNILLVEDNLINIKVIQVYMKDKYNLDYARTGVQAVKMANEKEYSLILMDINLGVGMDGVKAAKAIKAIDGYQNTPIVALTGYAMESDKEKLFAEGLTHHMSKPFDKATLLDFVDSVLEEAGI